MTSIGPFFTFRTFSEQAHSVDTVSWQTVTSFRDTPTSLTNWENNWAPQTDWDAQTVGGFVEVLSLEHSFCDGTKEVHDEIKCFKDWLRYRPKKQPVEAPAPVKRCREPKLQARAQKHWINSAVHASLRTKTRRPTRNAYWER